MKKWTLICVGVWSLTTMATFGGVVVAATRSSVWTLDHQHQAMVERYEASHHGQSPLPVDETEHHPDMVRP